jgi:hypothetical protein
MTTGRLADTRVAGEGAGIQAGTFADAAAHGDLLVLAVLGDAAEAAIAQAGPGRFGGISSVPPRIRSAVAASPSLSRMTVSRTS